MIDPQVIEEIKKLLLTFNKVRVAEITEKSISDGVNKVKEMLGRK